MKEKTEVCRVIKYGQMKQFDYMNEMVKVINASPIRAYRYHNVLCCDNDMVIHGDLVIKQFA